MSFSPPAALRELLDARDGPDREVAWAAFVSEYSGLILHVARSRHRDHDAVMNCYEFVLDHLRRGDHARLRRYVGDGRGKFTTWLLVVVRRLSVDFYRQQYGRLQTDNEERHAQRRLLVDLVSDEVLLESVADPESADATVLQAETMTLLAQALDELTPSDRLMLRLRFDDDMSVPEIARWLGAASPFVMYRRLQHTLGLLRRALERAGVERVS